MYMQLLMQYALVGVGLAASHIAKYILFRSSIRNALMTSFSSPHMIGVLFLSFLLLAGGSSPVFVSSGHDEEKMH